MMESTPEQNKASVLEAFDTLFQQAAAPKTRRESAFRAGRRCCSDGRA